MAEKSLNPFNVSQGPKMDERPKMKLSPLLSVKKLLQTKIIKIVVKMEPIFVSFLLSNYRFLNFMCIEAGAESRVKILRIKICCKLK